MVRLSVPLKLIRLPDGGFHIMCHGSVDGYKLHLLIDTGASMTVFDIRRFRQIRPQMHFTPYHKPFTGIGSNHVKTFQADLQDLTINKIKFPESTFLFIDLHSINQIYASYDLERIDGIVGGDLLTRYNALIDYKAFTISFEDNNELKLI